jgi:hypothetical protein
LNKPLSAQINPTHKRRINDRMLAVLESFNGVIEVAKLFKGQLE